MKGTALADTYTGGISFLCLVWPGWQPLALSTVPFKKSRHPNPGRTCSITGQSNACEISSSFSPGLRAGHYARGHRDLSRCEWAFPVLFACVLMCLCVYVCVCVCVCMCVLFVYPDAPYRLMMRVLCCEFARVLGCNVTPLKRVGSNPVQYVYM